MCIHIILINVDVFCVCLDMFRLVKTKTEKDVGFPGTEITSGGRLLNMNPESQTLVFCK